MKRAIEARRRAILLPALLFTIPSLAFAQGRGADPAAVQERINAEIDQVIEELQLSEDEAEVTRTVLQDGADARMEYMQEVRASGQRPDRETFQEKMSEIDAATEEMLAQYLSEEKMQAFRELREKRRTEARAQRGRRGQGRGQGSGGP